MGGNKVNKIFFYSCSYVTEIENASPHSNSIIVEISPKVWPKEIIKSNRDCLLY